MTQITSHATCTVTHSRGNASCLTPWMSTSNSQTARLNSFVLMFWWFRYAADDFGFFLVSMTTGKESKAKQSIAKHNSRQSHTELARPTMSGPKARTINLNRLPRITRGRFQSSRVNAQWRRTKPLPLTPLTFARSYAACSVNGASCTTLLMDENCGQVVQNCLRMRAANRLSNTAAD